MEKEIKEAPEPKILAKGTEVKARIIAVREGVSDKNGAQWYQPVFDVPANPMVMEFNDFLWDPLDNAKIEPKQAARNAFRFKTFVQAFGIDLTRPFSWTDDLPGKEGWLIVGVKKSDEYGEQNSVSKYIVKR
jgi:hypothetical protein